MCPRRSRPRSAAKQGRSFRVAPINSAPTRFSEATSWQRVPPEIGHRPRVKCTFYEKNLTRQNPASISGSRTGLPGCGPCPGVRIEKRTLECSCVPKGVGAAFCSKTAPFLSCVANKPSGGLCAQGGRGHVLQQNRAVLFVWLQ